MSKIEDQVTDLLSALQLEQRKAWADEMSIPVVLGGRCAGSYGCGGVTTDPAVKQEPLLKGDIISDLSDLVSAGVNVENATAALARKYENEPKLENGLLKLLQVMRDPNSKKANFLEAIKALHEKGSRGDINAIVTAIEQGRLDEI